jgi:hypothetical protein
MKQKITIPYFTILLVSAILLSCLSSCIYIRENLHIVHFDSKGHQMVARRILDNLNPGFKQIGAFWLPLPHLLYFPLVQSDYIYYHGLAGTPFSMISFVLTVLLLYRLLEKVLDPLSAFCGSVLYLTNPNMLYLQSTALTENMCILFLVGATYFFVLHAASKNRKMLFACSVVSALGVLTRYENWFVLPVVALLILVLNLKEKRGLKNLVIDETIFAALTVAAVCLAFWLSWYTTGHWYTDITYKYKTDFQPAQGSYVLSIAVILYTIGKLISFDWAAIALLGFFALVRKRFRDPVFLASLVLLAPILTYMHAYGDGHPTRIRYGLTFVPAAAYFISYWPGRSRLFTYLFAVFLAYVNLFSPFYWNNATVLMVESMRDGENIAIQRDLYNDLHEQDDGKLILVDMGEIGATIYDLKLPIKRFVHQGAKPYWNDAYTYGHPETVVGWVFMTQGDKLWVKFHDDPNFHTHFMMVARRGFLELYKQTPNEQQNIASHPKHAVGGKFVMPNLPGI